MTLNDALRNAEREYLIQLFENDKVNGFGWMAKKAGISRDRLIEKLYAHGLIQANHLGMRNEVEYV